LVEKKVTETFAVANSMPLRLSGKDNACCKHKNRFSQILRNRFAKIVEWIVNLVHRHLKESTFICQKNGSGQYTFYCHSCVMPPINSFTL